MKIKWVPILIFLSALPLVCPTIVLGQTEETGRWTLIFGGDTSLARGVSWIAKKFGPSYPLGDTTEILNQADVTLVNLECSIAKSGTLWGNPSNTVYLRGDPEATAVLKTGGIDYVSLANNHVLDFGPEALLETTEHLKAAGIKWAGAGKTLTEAKTPVVLDKPPGSIAFFSATDNAPLYSASQEKPGTWYITIPPPEEFFTNLHTEIERLRNNGVTLIIFSLHWGPNMVENPTEEIKTFARQLVDEGVDIIHGHSAHVFQGIEVYRGKIVFYGTGDFINDFLPVAGTEEQFLYKVTAEVGNEKPRVRFKQIELIPIRIENMRANLAETGVAASMISKMRGRSSVFGTEILSKDGLGLIEVKQES